MTREQMHNALSQAYNEQEAKLNAANAKIAELTAQLLHREHQVKELGVYLAKAESERGKRMNVRAALVKVEAYLASEDGPIAILWENCDIGDYDDYQQEWPETLADVRNFSVDPVILGSGTEWPVIDLYREVLAVLSPERLTGAEINALHPQIIQPEQPAESDDANAPI